MVDVGCFHGQVAGRVEGITFILRGLVGRLTHCQEVCKSGSMVTPPQNKESLMTCTAPWGDVVMEMPSLPISAIYYLVSQGRAVGVKGGGLKH